VSGLALTRGRWYWEVEVVEPGIGQVGFADVSFLGNNDEGQGVGDDRHSFAYDGQRILTWVAGSRPFGRPWNGGDVICVAVDLDARAAWFGLNGDYAHPMGLSFSHLVLDGGITPGASLQRTSPAFSCRFNLGQSFTRHSPPPGFRLVHEALASGGKQVSPLVHPRAPAIASPWFVTAGEAFFLTTSAAGVLHPYYGPLPVPPASATGDASSGLRYVSSVAGPVSAVTAAAPTRDSLTAAVHVPLPGVHVAGFSWPAATPPMPDWSRDEHVGCTAAAGFVGVLHRPLHRRVRYHNRHARGISSSHSAFRDDTESLGNLVNEVGSTVETAGMRKLGTEGNGDRDEATLDGGWYWVTRAAVGGEMQVVWAGKGAATCSAPYTLHLAVRPPSSDAAAAPPHAGNGAAHAGGCVVTARAVSFAGDVLWEAESTLSNPAWGSVSGEAAVGRSTPWFGVTVWPDAVVAVFE